MIKVEALVKNYGPEIKVLKGINFVFEDGKTYAIIGSSGGGKSTFIRCLNLLEVPTAGTITFNGVEISEKSSELAKYREKVGMVFQNFNLFEHMRVLENITYALKKVKKIDKASANQKAQALLTQVGLSHREQAYPHNLSGGEKQRVAIARALAMEPEVLLFDEPTSALDPEMTTEVLKVLKDLNHTGMTMIVVTHEMNFAKEVADYIVYMDGGEIVECTPADVFFEKPQTERAQAFIQNML
ncbi:MAG: amino acid ABC transporter ATP-binding protein [Erysipelotrichaceae bacterium]